MLQKIELPERPVEIDIDALTEFCGHHVAFASDCELPVGVWPERVHVVEYFGDVIAYDRFEAQRSTEGEVEAVVYKTDDGKLLRIYND